MFLFIKTDVTLNGIPLTMLTHHDDKVVGGLLRTRHVASEVLDYLRSAIKPRSRVLDAGANIGSTAIYLAKVEPTATIDCFEPDPLNFALLTLNIAWNHVPNVCAYHYALGQNDGFIKLYRHKVNHGDHRSARPIPSDADAPNFEPVPVLASMVNPADFFQSTVGNQASNHFDLIKIDTQGADFDILAACLPLIGQDSTVVVEYSPYHLYRNGTLKTDVANLVNRFSSIEIITPMTHPQRTDQLTMEQILSSYDAFSTEWKGYCDLVLRGLQS